MNEEQLSLFLLQLPSDLKFDQLTAPLPQPSSDSQESANSTADINPPPRLLPNGKLGKLRLYKSGKVKLVTENGNSYDVNSGLTAAFMQCLTSVEVPPAEESDGLNIKTEGEYPSSSGNSSNNNQHKKSNKLKDNMIPGKEGKVCFLGNITRKLVVTPDYELGIRRQNTTKATNQTNDAQNVLQFIKQEEDMGDEMILDDEEGGGEIYDDES